MLLLVDDYQAQVGELHIVGGETYVPTTTFNFPLFSPSFVSLASAAEAVRDKLPTAILNGAKRWRKVATCCLAKTVVGTATATCFPDSTTAAAARNATSVLPNPTSPQMTLSMGWPDARSSRTSRTAFAWSTVVKYGKRATNRSYTGPGGANFRSPPAASLADVL